MDGRPRRYGGPWRWVGAACGAAFALVGASTLAYGTDVGAIVIGVVCVALGTWFAAQTFFGVVVLRDDRIEVPSGWVTRRKIPWDQVRSLEFGEDTHTTGLTIRFPVLVIDGTPAGLRELAWYSMRSEHVPRRVRRFAEAVRRKIGN